MIALATFTLVSLETRLDNRERSNIQSAFSHRSSEALVMVAPILKSARRLLAVTTFAFLFGLAAFAPAQPSAELIDKLLALSKQKKLDARGEKDELRKLLIERHNVALDELKEACEEFQRNLATNAIVYEAARHFLQTELEVQARPEGRVKVLEKALEIVRWYENRQERGVKANQVPRTDLLRTRYQRLTLEIDLLKAKRAVEVQAAK